MAFSGGVDSSLLATICKDAGYKVTLLTVGFDGSHDVEFASKVSKEMNMECKTLLVDDESFLRTSKTVMKAIPTGNISWTLDENMRCCAIIMVIAKISHINAY